MCLIAFAWRAHPRYELVLAANRDEFHQRPAEAAQFWPEAPQLLAGRDLSQGGTWCGVTRAGRVAAVTNYRDPSRAEPGKRSRGHLVRDYLLGSRDAETAAEAIEKEKGAYSEFNLLLGDPESLWYVGSRALGPQRITPGVHGISNGAFDLAWPKVRHARAGLEQQLQQDRLEPAALFEVLASRRIAPDGELPDTGVGLQLERFLSAPFIVSPEYGTRASTVLLIARSGEVRFVERRFGPDGTPIGVTDERFMLEV
ncbi:MAG TPA: NRDE family protein [Nevskiales bacterium]|nr:NRDE family protein [Nevskiales bacterium]